MPRRPSSPAARRLAAGLLLALALPGLALAASPAPSVSEQPPSDPNTQVWQDQPLPPDIPAGTTVDVGFTVWDVARGTLSQVNSADVRVHPKTGKAAPTEAKTRADWAGHVRASITIPKGGLGTIEIGFPGQECHDDGTCQPIFIPFAWGGVGPPPQAPRSALVIATIHTLAAPVVAGQPFDVDVDIAPKAEWDPTALALPKGVVVVASNVHGDPLASADMRLVNEGQYTGTLTIPDGGDANLVVGFAGTPNPEMIDRSILRIRVGGGDNAGTAAPAATAGRPTTPASVPAGSDLPILPLALGGIGIAAAALLIRRVFADL